jgi:hypothetical protein
VNDLYPDRYKSLYELVSFTNVPYAEAMRQDREQRTLVDRLLAIPDVRAKLGSPELREMVDAFMASVPPQMERMEPSRASA